MVHPCRAATGRRAGKQAKHALAHVTRGVSCRATRPSLGATRGARKTFPIPWEARPGSGGAHADVQGPYVARLGAQTGSGLAARRGARGEGSRSSIRRLRHGTLTAACYFGVAIHMLPLCGEHTAASVRCAGCVCAFSAAGGVRALCPPAQSLDQRWAMSAW